MDFFLLFIFKNNNNILPYDHKLLIGSAQVKSSIFLAGLWGLRGTTTIFETLPSRNHTEIMLKYLGAKIVVRKKNKISLSSPNFLEPKDIIVPGDFSSAAFVIVATLITSDSHVEIKEVGLNYFRVGIDRGLKKNEC